MSTPSLLPYSTDQQFYIDELRNRYGGRTITTPDGYTVKFFLGEDKHCLHALNGKGDPRRRSPPPFNAYRSRHIAYIEYILMDVSTRVIRINRQSGNICFVAHALKYAVICKPSKKKSLKFVTQLIGTTKYMNDFDNRSKYIY